MRASTIGSLLERDLERKIEEIIKVDQLDEASVHAEITEYVATDRLREHYRHLLSAIAEAPSDPHEGVGVWISGFFGSGKSSFAKNLGYVVANRTVLGQSAADLMKKQLEDDRCSALIDNINARIQTEVVMFDVQTDRALGGSSAASISHAMYRCLLRALDYAEDFDIAELELSLEADGRLEDFVARVEKRFGPWRVRRKMSQKMNEASAILAEMDPKTYPQPDSWARAQAGKRVEPTPALLVARTFDLAARRRRGKAIMYILDEVGAYVARSDEKIEDLRAVVEQLGKESKNRVKGGLAPAPVWVVVTSQEKLEEVVAAIDSKRVQLAKLQDRFKYRIDLAPSDIREVASKRVLAKTKAGKTTLKALHEKCEGRLESNLGLERTARRSSFDGADFVAFYPYPPHFLDLCIDVMSGIRLQPGAPRHLGGSNRTIISQAYAMLTSERTRLAESPVGRLVTMDLVFELVEGNLSTEKRKDISDIEDRFGAGCWEGRVAKAVALLEVVKDLPRTEANLASVLCDQVEGSRPVPEVTAAVERLVGAKFLRHTEDGYKLLTGSEKQWDNERRGMDPKPRDRAEIVREVVRDVFSAPSLKGHTFEGKTFRVGLTVDDANLEDGQVPLHVVTADSPDDLSGRRQATQTRSRQKEHANDVFWVFGLTEEIDELVADVFRSRQMVQKYDQLRSQGKVSAEESACLASEKQEGVRLQTRLKERVSEALQGGVGLFRGASYEASALGKSLAESMRKLFDRTLPDLYPKLAMGSRPLKGTEIEEILKAANLSGLSQVFYGGEQGLALIVRDGQKYVPDVNAPVAREVLDFLKERASYGEKVTGKDVLTRFTGMGYGWDRELCQLVLAVLLRAGAIEVTHQGRRYRGHQDALVREPLTKAPAFRSATFSPRETVGLKALATAAERYEEITGEEVDVEEGAIAEALKKLATSERDQLLGLLAKVRAHRLAAREMLEEYDAALQAILGSASDDCVRELASQGRSLKETIARVRRIREVLTDEGIALVARARGALQLARAMGDAERAAALARLVDDPQVHEQLPQLRRLSEEIELAYDGAYRSRHAARREAAERAMDTVRNQPAFELVPEELRQDVLAPLASRRCAEKPEREGGEATCRRCGATLGQMDSDLAAIGALRASAEQAIQAIASPRERVERVRLADLAAGPIDSPEALRAFLERLEDALGKLLAEGASIVIE